MNMAACAYRQRCDRSFKRGGRGLQTVHPESHKEGLCAVAVKCRTGGYGAGEPTRCSCADTMITGESVFVRVNAPGQMLLEPERKGPLKDHSCSIHVSFARLLLGSGLDLWRFNEEPVEEQQAVTHTHTRAAPFLKWFFSVVRWLQSQSQSLSDDKMPLTRSILTADCTDMALPVVA